MEIRNLKGNKTEVRYVEANSHKINFISYISAKRNNDICFLRCNFSLRKLNS